jgi:hypothetical protein
VSGVSRRSFLGGAALIGGVIVEEQTGWLRRLFPGFGAGSLRAGKAEGSGLIERATLAPPASPFGPMVENGGIVLVRKRVRADGFAGEVLGYEQSLDGGRSWGRVVGSLV